MPQVWRDPYFRRMAPIGFFNYGGMIAIQTLWAGPVDGRVAGYAPLQAAGGLFIINVCMLVAFWSWGMAQPLAGPPRPGRRPPDRLGPAARACVVLAVIIAAGPAAGAWPGPRSA